MLLKNVRSADGQAGIAGHIRSAFEIALVAAIAPRALALIFYQSGIGHL
ncbi:MAG: hypothetical protein F6J93_02185 [Oscillatoria sp. SIO1A7]|nr:hypothetical protein [Oscillatoria sp. SIO1A7]